MIMLVRQVLAGNGHASVIELSGELTRGFKKDSIRVRDRRHMHLDYDLRMHNQRLLTQ